MAPFGRSELKEAKFFSFAAFLILLLHSQKHILHKDVIYICINLPSNLLNSQSYDKNMSLVIRLGTAEIDLLNMRFHVQCAVICDLNADPVVNLIDSILRQVFSNLIARIVDSLFL